MGIGATRDYALAYEMGRVTAREGRALGIHMAFAPVLDVNNNPKNPVISLRSFGENPQLVAQLGAAFVRGIQDNGMLATGEALSRTRRHRAELAPRARARQRVARPARQRRARALPRRRARRACAAIMTFHGYTARPRYLVAPRHAQPAHHDRPAARTDSAFRASLVTDALDMNGVLGKMTMAEVTQRAVLAGNDVLLMPTDIAGAIDAVVDGVRTGRFPESRIDAVGAQAARRQAGDGARTASGYVDVQAMRAVVGDSANRRRARGSPRSAPSRS